MLFEKYQSAHHEHDRYRQQQPVGANLLRSVATELRPRYHQRSYEHRHHSEARFPNSKPPSRDLLDGALFCSLSRQETDAHKPGHSRHEWDIEQTAGVIEM